MRFYASLLFFLLIVTMAYSVGNIHIADITYPEQVRPGQSYTVTFKLTYNVSADERGEGIVFIYPEDPPAAGTEKGYAGQKSFDLTSKQATLTINQKAPANPKTLHYSFNISYYIGGTPQDPDHTYLQKKGTFNVSVSAAAPETVAYKRLQVYPPAGAPAANQNNNQNNQNNNQNNNPPPPPVQEPQDDDDDTPPPPVNSGTSNEEVPSPQVEGESPGAVTIPSSERDTILYFFGFGCCLSLAMLGLIGGYLLLQRVV